MTQTALTTQDRINAAAAEHGWKASTFSGLVVTYRKGTRYIRVLYTVRGAVHEVNWQTGSYGGRKMTSTDSGKAERVIGLLGQDRWTKTAVSA